MGLRLDDGVPVLTVPDVGAFEDVREVLRDHVPDLLDGIGGRAIRLDLGARELQLFDLRRILHLLREEFRIDVTGLYVLPTAIHRYAERELKLKLFVPRPVRVEPPVEAPPRAESATSPESDPALPATSAATAAHPLTGAATAAPGPEAPVDDVGAAADDASLPGLNDLLAALQEPPPDLLVPADAPAARPAGVSSSEIPAPSPATGDGENDGPALLGEALRRPVPLPDLPPDGREEPVVDAHGGRRVLTLTRTLRSGASIRYDGDVVIYGDVNAGAQIRAGGNVTVLGKLRGVVHAGGAGGPGADEAWILAFDLAPTQLRIGRHIAIAPNRAGRAGAEDAILPEIAAVQDGAIVIEPYKGRLRR